MQPNAQLPVIGLDIAKNVFQLHIVDAETGEIQRRQLKREKLAEFFVNRQPSLVALEACGGAHHWARTLLAMWHQVCCRRPKIDHLGVRTKTWTGYAISPRLSRYSAGLREPRDILIRFSLYQRM